MNYKSIYAIASEGVLGNIWNDIKHTINGKCTLYIESNKYDLEYIRGILKSSGWYADSHINYSWFCYPVKEKWLETLVTTKDYNKALKATDNNFKYLESMANSIAKAFNSKEMQSTSSKVVIRDLLITGLDSLQNIMKQDPLLPALIYTTFTGEDAWTVDEVEGWMVNDAVDKYVYDEDEKDKAYDLVDKCEKKLLSELDKFGTKHFKPLVLKVRDIYANCRISIVKGDADPNETDSLDGNDIMEIFRTRFSPDSEKYKDNVFRRLHEK